MGNIRSRTEEEKQQKQSMILEAASKVFSELGFQKATMTAVAKKAGLSRTLVNFYYNDKNQLHAALEKKTLNEIAFLLNQNIDLKNDPFKNLKIVADTFFDYAQKNTGLYECLLRPEFDLKISNSTLINDTQMVNEIVAKVISKGVEQNILHNPFDTLLEATINMWCIIHGFITISTNKSEILQTHWGVSQNNLRSSTYITLEKLFKVKS